MNFGHSTGNYLSVILRHCVVAGALSVAVLACDLPESSSRFKNDDIEAEDDNISSKGPKEKDPKSKKDKEETDSNASSDDSSDDSIESESDASSSVDSQDSEDPSQSDDDSSEEDCTRTQGYWKTHNMEAKQPKKQVPWPISEDTDLCGKTWLEILHTPTHGDAWYILAHQWIAAKLNVASGANPPADVDEALQQGEALLLLCTIEAIDRSAAIELSELLDAFNNGQTDRDCGEDTEGETGEDTGDETGDTDDIIPE